MPAQFAYLTSRVRSGSAVLCLTAMCLLAAASVLVRFQAYRWQQRDGGAPGWEETGGPVDLGGGYRLPRAAARPLTVRVETCGTPGSVNFVRASPYEPDPSLAGRPDPGDRVSYVYHGRDLGSRLITMRLNAIYLVRVAHARLTMRKTPATDDLALKIILPAGCEASPDGVLSVLRSTLGQGPPSPVQAAASQP